MVRFPQSTLWMYRNGGAHPSCMRYCTRRAHVLPRVGGAATVACVARIAHGTVQQRSALRMRSHSGSVLRRHRENPRVCRVPTHHGHRDALPLTGTRVTCECRHTAHERPVPHYLTFSSFNTMPAHTHTDRQYRTGS